jgi:hypothetical protein
MLRRSVLLKQRRSREINDRVCSLLVIAHGGGIQVAT